MAGPVCRPRLLDPTGEEEPTLGLPISPFMDCSGHSWPSSRPISQAHSGSPTTQPASAVWCDAADSEYV
ncbi:unnamed protein product [Arctogadus glacialis]